MKNIIEVLFYGNIDPQARAVKKAFTSFVDASSVILGKSELDSFIVGFRLGARFVYDTFVDNKTLYNNLLAEESE